MSKAHGKQRLMLFSIHSTYSTYKLDSGQYCRAFLEFADLLRCPKSKLRGHVYSHSPNFEIVKKYFELYLEKTDYENPLDRFKELHKKLTIRLEKFCKPWVECVRGLILFFSYQTQLLTTYEQFFEAAQYLNDLSKYKINYDELPVEAEEKIIARLETEELLLRTLVSFAFQTYKVSLKSDSKMFNQYDVFACKICKFDYYKRGPISTNVPSFYSLRRSFGYFNMGKTDGSAPERVIRAYKKIEAENKRGCKAAVQGLYLFFGYYDGIIQNFEELIDVALAMTKYKRPVKTEDQEGSNIIAANNSDPDAFFSNFYRQQPTAKFETLDAELDIKPEPAELELSVSPRAHITSSNNAFLDNFLANMKNEPMDSEMKLEVNDESSTSFDNNEEISSETTSNGMMLIESLSAVFGGNLWNDNMNGPKGIEHHRTQAHVDIQNVAPLKLAFDDDSIEIIEPESSSHGLVYDADAWEMDDDDIEDSTQARVDFHNIAPLKLTFVEDVVEMVVPPSSSEGPTEEFKAVKMEDDDIEDSTQAHLDFQNTAPMKFEFDDDSIEDIKPPSSSD